MSNTKGIIEINPEQQSKQPLPIEEIKTQIKTIQKVMKEVMKEKEHFGVLPGCGKKAVLLKPGAEKIMATFRIAPEFSVEDLSNDDEARYRITCSGIYAPDKTFLGQGLGECSSNEEKYKWRQAICDEEYDDAPDNRKRIKYVKDYRSNVSKIKKIRTESADKANTVLKMAVKRAQVAMVLTVTAASDIFSQDLEEKEENSEVLNETNQNKSIEIDKKPHDCSECGSACTEKEKEYSLRAFNRIVCFSCQKKVKNQKNDADNKVINHV